MALAERCCKPRKLCREGPGSTAVKVSGMAGREQLHPSLADCEVEPANGTEDENLDNHLKSLRERLTREIPCFGPLLFQGKSSDFGVFPREGNLKNAKIDLAHHLAGLWRGRPVWLMQLATAEGSGAFGYLRDVPQNVSEDVPGGMAIAARAAPQKSGRLRISIAAEARLVSLQQYPLAPWRAALFGRRGWGLKHFLAT